MMKDNTIQSIMDRIAADLESQIQSKHPKNGLFIEIDSLFNLIFTIDEDGPAVNVQQKNWVDGEIEDETILGLGRDHLLQIAEWASRAAKEIR
jgi:hypothetical protein